jgi:thiamine-monophosphate kinase
MRPEGNRDGVSPLSEFGLIEQYFAKAVSRAKLGPGDDAALIKLTPGQSLAVTTDTLNEGVHFLRGVDPAKLGHKALAVNLSDLAAMGALPRYALLALSMPTADPAWLEAFSRGFFALARRHDVELIGGDTTRGPLSVTITAMGEVGCDALRRDGAKSGDEIWVSGTLGGAALGLACLQGRAEIAQEDRSAMVALLEMPIPRVELGIALRGVANAAIDLSDGLTGDLGHIVERSGVAAVLDWSRIPRPSALARLGDDSIARQMALAGGDDYELLFTAAAARADEILAIGSSIGVALERIGTIRRREDADVLLEVRGVPANESSILHGHDHFRASGDQSR